jgi:ABC-type histidine transport system ATPase subunit
VQKRPKDEAEPRPSSSRAGRLAEKARPVPVPTVGRPAAARRHRAGLALKPKVVLFDEPTSAWTLNSSAKCCRSSAISPSRAGLW